MRLIRRVALAVSVGMLAPLSSGSLTTSLSYLTDLGAISVGQTIALNVFLNGPAEDTPLEGLFSTIKFDGELLGTPFLITAGTIVPAPLADPGNFLTARLPGIADASLLTFATTQPFVIAKDGLFFSCAV